jgi:hypothetical protein
MDGNKSAARRKASKVLAEIRLKTQFRSQNLTPGRRMEIVFLMSMDALQLSRAGRKAQGFSETRVQDFLRSRTR